VATSNAVPLMFSMLDAASPLPALQLLTAVAGSGARLSVRVASMG
jgi:hypothetical protein